MVPYMDMFQCDKLLMVTYFVKALLLLEIPALGMLVGIPGSEIAGCKETKRFGKASGKLPFTGVQILAPALESSHRVIKSVIDRKRPTCQNNNRIERATNLNSQ